MGRVKQLEHEADHTPASSSDVTFPLVSCTSCWMIILVLVLSRLVYWECIGNTLDLHSGATSGKLTRC